MMPIRGTVWTARFLYNGKGRLLPKAGISRHISMSTRPKALQSAEECSSRLLRSQPWRLQPYIYQKLNSRFASTSSDNSSYTYIPISTPGDVSTPTSDQMSVPTDTFNTIPFDGLSSTDQLPIAEKVGYLKELGIDYGWGVTSSIQWLLEHVHVYSGSPWWASIALTAIVVRLGVFPLYVTAMDTSGRLSAIQPQMVPLQQRINLAKQSQDQTTMLTAIAEMRGLFRTNNIKFRNMFWPLLVQFPVGFCTFRLLRAMADLPVPGLENQGFLWMPDLTVPDPYFVIPIALGSIMYLTFKRGGEIGTQSTMTTPMRTLFQYFLPAMSTLITLFMPGALQVTFATTSLASLIQTSLFRQPWFRSTLGISKYIPPTPPAAPQTRYPGTMSVYQPPSPVESTESEKKGVVGGAISEIKGAAKQVMSSARRSVEQRQGAKAGGRLTAAELRRAKEYEERRKQELEFEKERGRVSGRRRSNRNVR